MADSASVYNICLSLVKLHSHWPVFFWFLFVLLAVTVSKKLISCTSCKNEHQPRDGIFCVYTSEAKKLCTTLRVSEDDFALHIGIEKICTDSQEYLEGNVKVESTTINDELIQRLVDDNICQREALTCQDEKLDIIISDLRKLFVSGKDTVDNSEELVGMGALAKEPVKPTSDLSEQLTELYCQAIPILRNPQLLYLCLVRLLFCRNTQPKRTSVPSCMVTGHVHCTVDGMMITTMTVPLSGLQCG